jgi:hypothetical protein
MEYFPQLPWTGFWCLAYAIISLIIALYFALGVYRLYFHPLAKFPGPKLAALSYLYELYYDAVEKQGGQFCNQIIKLHQQYGPVVRVTPDELHVSDPEWIDRIYAGSGKRRNKNGYFMRQANIPLSTWSTIDHETHRLRRGALSKFFSKASVAKLELLIQEKARKLCGQILTHRGSGHPVNLEFALSCFTTDVVTEYSFARSYDFLADPRFKSLKSTINGGEDAAQFLKHFPIAAAIIHSIPQPILSKLMPDASTFLEWQNDMKNDIHKVKRHIKNPNSTGPEKPHPTIFVELLTGSLPKEEKSFTRMHHEVKLRLLTGRLYRTDDTKGPTFSRSWNRNNRLG